ncbi:calcium-binding protein [Maliponia aquimaris]|uniref:Hemolysin, chromosomal n=1 Tax=Maliponia aquimaris TaxID=1673631 RepID=A0A238L2U2_9RHOB|nr:calcium-binding protein [Maliponia aquimaris]SMX49393.1 Hemolysin, chromosomal [Maliponia aquimaris]
MTSFTITGTTFTPQVLAGIEVGYVATDARLIVSGSDAIFGNGFSTLTINGTVSVADAGANQALDLNGTTAIVAIGPDGFVTSSNSDAIRILVSDTVRLRNAGTILSGDDGIDIRPSDSFSTVNVANTGTIVGHSDGAILDAGASFSHLINSGTIIAETGVGVFMNISSTGSTLLHNTGTIIGAQASFDVFLGTGNNSIFNSGIMSGRIYLGAGQDRYDGGGGRVNGPVSAGDDNDTLAGGEFSDEFYGDAGDDFLLGRGGDDKLDGWVGNDLIFGGQGNDNMNGGPDNDTLNGNAGDDTVLGGSGNDVLVGQDGSDSLDGGADNDVLNGQDGEDILEGGSGNDILRGGNGDDALAGGEGFDLLTGGAGADSFVFRALSETVVGANRDQILDFQKGVDIIVVAGLHPGVFEFRGTLPFAPSGNPELRLFETTTGSTIVQMDADGNGTIDAEIRVANVTGLTATDFVL